jgi:hypothetical protein
MLSPANNLFVSQTVGKLSQADSVVPLSLSPFCSELLHRCRADKDVLSASAYLMEALKRDFVDELENCDGTPALSPAPKRIASVIFGNGPRDLIETVEIQKNDWYAFSRIFLGGEGSFVEDLLRKLGELLGVGDFLFHYPATGSVTLRFPPAQVFLGALAVFGDGPRAQPTSEPSTAAEVREMMADDRRPWRLDVLPYDVHGRKAMHPLIGSLHDLLHLLRLRLIPREVRTDLIVLFDSLQRVAAPADRRSEIAEVVLEGPFEDQMDRRNFSTSILYERLFRQVNAYLGRVTTDEIKLFVGEFYDRLREDLRGHPRAREVLHAFAKEIYRKRA